MKPSSEAKLVEWRLNALRKGLNPNDLRLFTNLNLLQPNPLQSPCLSNFPWLPVTSSPEKDA